VVKEERNITQTVKIRKANWIGHTWHRHCLPEHVAEGNIEGMGTTRKKTQAATG